jgi:hypothetical protein
METNRSEPRCSEALWWVWKTVQKIARDRERRQEAIAMVEEALAAPGRLLDREIEHVESLRDRWLWSLDPDFQPSRYARRDATEVLQIKSRDCLDAQDYNTAVRYAWERWQYSDAGTVDFCYALADLADCAAYAGKLKLVRQALDLYRTHYELLVSTINDPDTPAGYYEIATRLSTEKHLGPLHFAIPVSAALYGLGVDPNACWIWILELAVYKVPFRKGGYEDRLQCAAEALVTYYTQTGDAEALDRLNAFLTETQPK